MKIILRQDIDSLGKMGEVVSVKDGYARNYLFPRKLAYEALPGRLRAIEEEKKQSSLRSQKELRFAQQRGTDLKNITVTINVKVGEDDRLFGSVTSLDISRSLKEMNFDIDKRLIDLEEPIRLLGEHIVNVKLHNEVKVPLKIIVKKETEKK